jgi:hypothetical protein
MNAVEENAYLAIARKHGLTNMSYAEIEICVELLVLCTDGLDLFLI